jgi:transcriptional regulator with XRE-family HTH domain
MVSTLGQRLKQQRQKRGLSQRQLGTLAGVSYATISKVESGDSDTITAANLRSLARALGCSADWLIDLYGDEEETTTAV